MRPQVLRTSFMNCPIFVMSSVALTPNPITSVQPLFLGDLQWQPWQAWSHCDKTCGEGQRKRRRACFPPKNGGKECPGAGDPAYEEDGKCSEGPCSSKYTHTHFKIIHSGASGNVYLFSRDPLDGVGSMDAVLRLMRPGHDDQDEELRRRGGRHQQADPGSGLPRARDSRGRM